MRRKVLAVKKETLITAIVFLGVGFLGGYVYSARTPSAARSAPGAASPANRASQASAPGPGAGKSASTEFASQLPKGHPPIDDAEVIQFFKDAAAHNPADPAPRLKLANFLFDRREFAEAIAWYQQVLQRDSRDVDARTDMATCFFNLGDSRQALDELHQALSIEPRHEATLFNLVVVNLEGARNISAAEKALERLRAINPKYPNLDRMRKLLEQAAHSKQPLARAE
ncbi:MAG: tetratricopeptide repeat protein [Terriglobia bacterium]